MKISIVIATYNRLLELGELLESISKQTVLPHEVIIVNDGGESVAVLVDLYKELPIKTIELTENVKHVKARNIGVQQATGDAIMLCDDDDMIVANHIEQAQLYLREADLIYFDAEIVAFEIQDQTRYPLSRKTFAYQYDIEEMRKFSTYIPSGSVYKRNVHEKIGCLILKFIIIGIGILFFGQLKYVTSSVSQPLALFMPFLKMEITNQQN